MPIERFDPFANESDALTLNGLHVENRDDRVSIYGSLDLTRDQEGLAHAHILKALLDRIVEALRREALPEKIVTTPAKPISNPFTDT